MMLPSLNLLPPDRKHVFRIELFSRHLRWTLLVLFLALGAYTGVIAFASSLIDQKLTAQQQITSTEQQAAKLASGQSIDQEIAKFNALLTPVTALQKSYRKTTPIVVSFLELLPTGVSISSLEIDMTSNQLNAVGTALTRNDLLEMQENFEGSNVFTATKLPITNLLERTNISFTLTTTIQ